MDLSTKGSNLSSGMNGVSLAIMRVLMHENNGRTPVCLNKASSSDQGKVSDSSIPNTSDMGSMKVGGGYDTDIRASHPTIGTTIHERTEWQGGFMPGKVILYGVNID